MPTRRTRSSSTTDVAGEEDEGPRRSKRSSSRLSKEDENDVSMLDNDDDNDDENASENEDEVMSSEDEDDENYESAPRSGKSGTTSKKRESKRKTSNRGKKNANSSRNDNDAQQISIDSFAVKGAKMSKKATEVASKIKKSGGRRRGRKRSSSSDDDDDDDVDDEEEKRNGTDRENSQRPRRSARAGRFSSLNEDALANKTNADEDVDEESGGSDGDNDADEDADVVDVDNDDSDNDEHQLDNDIVNTDGGDEDEKKENESDTGRRKSSRRNKFKSSLAESSLEMSGIEVMNEYSSFRGPAKVKGKASNKDKKASKAKAVQKSPAIRHKSKRKHKSPVKAKDDEEEDGDVVEPDDDEEGEEQYEDSDEESKEEMRIQKILASRSETRKKWEEICRDYNTSEVDNGSRWFQESKKEKEKDPDTYEERYLVKWAGLSYLHCSWETKDDLLELVEQASTHLRNFFAKSHEGYFFTPDERGDGDYFDPSYTEVERILEITNNDQDVDDDAEHPHGLIFDREDPDYESGTGRQFLIKWSSLPYSDGTYEFERDLIINNIDYESHVEALEQRSKKPTKKDAELADKAGEVPRRKLFMTFGETNKSATGEKREAMASKFQKDLESQEYLNGGQLRDYQAEGVSWLLSNYINKRSCILADEMGLGKTIQTACYVNYVARTLKRRGPFLIVAPLSTIPHWTREFRGWTDLNTIVYYGSQEDRTLIRQNEFPFFEDRPEIYNQKSHFLKRCHPKKARKFERTWMVEVVITTPETLVLEDHKELCAVDWEILVVDEAHRLKNHESKLAVNMRNDDFHFNNIILLTGTPIQNNLNELWALLHFADKDKFPSLSDFTAEYGEMKSKEKIDQLHEEIRPYILRRLKEDVEKSVPPKEETLIEVELTSTQKQYYRALYEKNVQFLHRNKRKLDMPSISNLAMQLRKCCNSAFLINGVEEEIRRKEKKENSKISEADLLIKSSGKLVLLDKLLPRLKRDGHKVLIFSQFKIMLDIIEDYLNAKQFKHERIDGSITGMQRQNAIDRFQAKSENGKESPLVMLLTTKAGGVGINLTAADTVIIFDSDWNPQNDLQAQARCHRIGQTKSVKIYRLLSRKTYEMQMFHMSSLKMGLDQAVLQGVENKGSGSKGKTGLSKEEIEKLLRHGAYDIFNEEKAGGGDKASEAFINEDIDLIMSRAKTVVHDNTGSQSGVAGGTFSKASFKVPGSATKGTSKANDDAAAENVDIDDPDFWTKMVGEAQEESISPLVANKRRRFNGTYQEAREADVYASESEASADSSKSDDSDLSEDPSKLNEERQRWGGERKFDWDRKDVEKIVRLLLQFGYRRDHIFPSSGVKSIANKHPDFELKRMTAAVILLTLKEQAEEDAAAISSKASAEAKRLAETDGEDKKKADKSPSSMKQSEESISNTVPPETDMNALQESCFQQLLQQNIEWLTKGPFADGFAAFTASQRRTEEMKHWIKAKRRGDDDEAIESKPPTPLELAFNQNLLPALTSRGWNVEKVEKRHTKAQKTRYTFRDNSYDNVNEVLRSCVVVHPELSNVVSSILASVPSESETGKPTEREQETMNLRLLLQPDRLTLSIVTELLDSFAPLQLMADRFKSVKVSLPKRILSTCLQMYNAGVLLSKATTEAQGERTLLDSLVMLLKYHTKSSPPHPLWTPRHDALLVLGIHKHGFPVTDSVYLAMKSDASLNWESGVDMTKFQVTPPAQVEEFVKGKVSTAKAAASFLTEEDDLLEDLQGMDKENLVQALCLQKGSTSGWSVDVPKLERDLRNSKCDRPAFILPPRLDLLKRARIILGRLPTPQQIEFGAEPEETIEKPQDAENGASSTKSEEKFHKSGFIVIDLKDPKYIFLCELLRWITKVKQGSLRSWPKLIKFAISECDRLESEFGSKTAIKVRHHLTQVKAGFDAKISLRMLKNVIRIMLSTEPYGNQKNPQEPLVPFSPTAEPIQSVAVPEQKKVKLPRSTFFADAAIERCLKLTAQAASNQSPGKDSDMLPLTMTEYVLLRAVSSFGLPTWDENSKKNIAEGIFTNDGEMDLSWRMLCDALLHFSADWGKGDESAITAARVNEERLKKINAAPEAIKKASDKLSLLEKKAKEKRNVHRNALDLSEKPTMMAQKTIMLIEAVRRTAGSNEWSKSASRWMKHENGIGCRVVDWCRDEIRRWAKAVKVMNRDNMLPLCTVAAEYMKDSPDLSICMMVDKKSARTIFAQIAQQSRLRSIIRSEGAGFDAAVAKASKLSRKNGDIWSEEPCWWQCNDTDGPLKTPNHDTLLLNGIAKHGYFGFDDALLENGLYKDYDPEKENSILLKAAAQTRIYHLTRELNNIHSIKDKMLFTQSVMKTSPQNATEAFKNAQSKQQTLIGSFFNAQKQKAGEESAAKASKAPSPTKANAPSAGKSFVMDLTTPQEEEESQKTISVSPSGGDKRTHNQSVVDDVVIVDLDAPDKKPKLSL